ncbi:hornerin-like isoform X2 [Chrysoperla carnea]|uniref:hornerin-like isoform X2 n=1 Tax=Chrysoperla carnea TaxID=189513 RepID=UPI001D0930D1|nr:hornerin-like isoform X2 [Chrysoperla carnea]
MAGIQENKTGSGSHYYQHGNIGGLNYQNVVIKDKVIGTQHNGGVGQGEYAGSQPIYGNNHFDSQGSHDGQQSFSYGEFDQHYGVVNEHVAQKGSGANYHQHNNNGGINIQGVEFQHQIIGTQNNAGVGQGDHGGSQYGHGYNQFVTQGSHYGHQGDTHDGVINGHGPHDPQKVSEENYHQHSNNGGVNIHDSHFQHQTIGTQNNAGVGQGDHGGSQYGHGYNQFVTQGSQYGHQGDTHDGVINGYGPHDPQKVSETNYHKHSNNGGVNIQDSHFQHQTIGTQNNTGVGQGDHGGSQYGHGYNQFVTQGSQYGHQGDTHDGVINGHGPHDPQKVSEANYHQHSNNGGVNIHDSHFQHQTIGTQNNAGVGQGDHGGSQYGHGYNQFVTQSSQFDQQGASHGGFDQNHGSIPGAINGHDSHDPQKGSEANYIQQGNSGGINIQGGVFEQEIIGVQNNGPVGQGENVGGQ